jgi:preprotein translocase subunit Sss1
MSEEQFSNISMVVCLTILMVFMGFIIWDLGKKSGAGKFGTAMLFLVLGVGVVGFVVKDLMIEFMTLH